MTRNASETKTKIVCTLGPATHDERVLREMIRAGMDVARVNFSHGTHDEHAMAIDTVRRLADEEGAVVAVMADLQGPKLRIGTLLEPVDLTHGDWISFVDASGEASADGTHHVLPLPHPELIHGAKVGQRLLLDDGVVEVEIREVRPDALIARVILGGALTSHKGISAPEGSSGVRALTDKDRADARFAVEQAVDLIALSFVRAPDDVCELRALLDKQGDAGRAIHILAKIERREAVERFDDILPHVDAVMVARGDLGIALSPQEVPMAQKDIIRTCNRAGVPVITATQMLQSMTDSPRPTRAESSDVANAILDGTDAVMLSAETAVGRYPVEAVTMIREISAVVEAQMRGESDEAPFEGAVRVHPVTDAIGDATARIADRLRARLIATTTWSGYTARQIARERPRQPIVAFTPQETVLRQLALVWGVTPVLTPPSAGTDEMIASVTRALCDRREVETGDRIVITGGIPVGGGGKTNFIKVHTI